MDNEVWRPVKGWEAFYLVSNKGRVKSLDRKCKFVPPDKLEGMMQAWDAASGHGHSR